MYLHHFRPGRRNPQLKVICWRAGRAPGCQASSSSVKYRGLDWTITGVVLARGSCSFSSNSFISVVACLQSDVGELLIDWYPVVVQAGRLQDDAGRPHHHRHREDPKEQPVQDHRHVLPVLLGLGGVLLGPSVLRDEVDTDAGLVHGRRASRVVKRRGLRASCPASWPRADTI